VIKITILLEAARHTIGANDQLKLWGDCFMSEERNPSLLKLWAFLAVLALVVSVLLSGNLTAVLIADTILVAFAVGFYVGARLSKESSEQQNQR
jgi:hypothetical protein